ncbi:MAG: OmpA family protein [Chitinophagaceae bacterium]
MKRLLTPEMARPLKFYTKTFKRNIGRLRYLGIVLIIICTSYTYAAAQSIPQRVKDKAKQKANSKVDEMIDKGLNKAEDKVDSAFIKKENDKKVSTDSINKIKDSTANTVKNNTQVNSFSDFEAGENVLFEDNFSEDALNDFPARWNTNGSGKIVSITGFEGKWFEVIHNSIVNPVMNKTLPENCTIEFDLLLQSNGTNSIPNIEFGLTPVRDILKEDIYYKEKFYIAIRRYNEEDGKTVEYGLQNPLGDKSDFPLTSYVNKILHVSLAINKTRIRVYLDQSKIIDLPLALTEAMRNNFYLNNVYTVPASELGMLFSNFRIASSDVDARSLLIKQLMEEGKTSTSDILFDVNSDVIKKESYGIINQFGEALQKNSSLKIKITGYTDSDGTDAENLSLSQKRAAAVKMYITENYPVAGMRIQTEGKGEAQPIADNNTAEGKAKNRRVEFIKL